MNPFKYYLGRTLQLLGFLTMTLVVIEFFTAASMKLLLYASLLGMVLFYGGTLLLEKSD
ncbi:MAG: hypothetical protein VYC17_05385 [Nitrospinota bacterium]|nr:hypothetical protein [Nitrospinota bacterium]